MEIVTKVMEKSWKFVGKNVYEPCYQWNFLSISLKVILSPMMWVFVGYLICPIQRWASWLWSYKNLSLAFCNSFQTYSHKLFLYVINKYTHEHIHTLFHWHSQTNTHTYPFSLFHTHGAGSDIMGKKLRMCACTYAVLCTKTTEWYDINITENIFILLSTRTTPMHCPILLLV